MSWSNCLWWVPDGKQKGEDGARGGQSMEVGEAEGWREVLCEPLWGNVTCKRCLFTHACRCLDIVKYVCIKSVFCPLGHWDTSLLLTMASQKWWLSLWCISHLYGFAATFISRAGWDSAVQPWELGALVGMLAWLTDLPYLHLSYIQCWMSASEGISCHTDTECRDAAVLPGTGFGRNRHWVSFYHL